MDPNQRHPSPVGTGMTQTFPVVQSGLEFQYGRMPGFQQMQGKPINIQGMVGNTVNTYNYISNFTGILPQGQGSVMTCVPHGTGSMMAAGIPQGQASMNMMTGVPGQGSMMASVHQGQSSMMAGVPQGQGAMLSGINQGQSSMVAGVSQHIQSSGMTGAHQQGPVIAGTNQQGQGSLMANVPQGQGSLLANVPQGQTGQIMTNIQGTAVPMNSYISAASSSGTLPSMGSFVASFNQPSFNMNQYVVPNCKGGMESWIGQQQQPPQAQGTGNALPSFGHFLMPQQYQQQSPRQQQTQHPQHHQQQIQHQQIFPTNQNQTRFPNAVMHQAGMGQIYPASSSVNPVMNQGQAFSNVNINTSMNVNVSMPDTSSTVVGPNSAMGVTHSSNLNFQNPCSNSLHVVQSSASSGSTISASCNQMTNTTSTVITTISSRSAVPVTANVHIRTSVSPAVVPSSVPMSLQSNVVNNSSSTTNNSIDVKQENDLSASSGCDNNNKLDNTKLSAAEISKHSDDDVSSDKSSMTSGEQVPTQTVIVPFGWRRVHEESAVTYYSPSNTKLGSLQEIKQYLLSEGTCKCGLECPVLVEKVFNFDPSVQSRQWSLDVHCTEDLTKLCNHKRKIIAMATFQSSKSYPLVTTSPSSISGMVGSAILSSGVTTVAGQPTKTKKETKSKKKKSKVQQSPYDGLLVSQLLAQRDKLKSGQCKAGTTFPGQQNNDNTVIKTPQETPLSPGGKGQNMGHQFNSLPSPAASDSGSQGRASVKDPADDLGPISSGKPIKLDFSRNIGPLDGLQRMSANTPSMSPGAASAKTSNQFMQQNPLTVQTVFPQEHFKDQVFIQQSPHTPSGHSPAGFGFPQGQLTSCTNYGVGVPMGTPMNMQQNPGLIVHGTPHHGNFPFYSIQNPPAGRYIGQNMMASGHPFHGGIGQNIPGPYHMGQQQQPPQQQQGMFQPPNAILQSMVDVGWPSQEPKKRQRKSRAKKDKKKVNCVFESDTPPPNVDVSQLQDHGRGPIPKVKKLSPSSTTTTSSSSFLENPTAFLAEQTALISNSLTSTLSSPKASNMGTPSSEIPISVSETKNCDTVDGDINSSELPESSVSASSSSTEISSTVSTTTTASINPPSKTTQHSNCFTSALPSAVCTSSSSTPIGMSVSSITPIGLSSDWRSSTSNSESHPTSTLTDSNNDMFTEDRCESLSPDSGPECPALNETITPSSVVHHTATNDTGEEPQPLKPGSIKSNITDKNILPNKTLTVSHIQTSANDSLTTTGTADGTILGKIPVSHTGTGPVSQIENVLGMVHRCNRNVGGLNPIQQMLGCQNTNEFPASNLLSAAARAQVVQQQQMGLFMGQSPHGLQVSQSLPINMGTGMAPAGGGLNVPLGLEFGTKISQNSKGMQILTSDDGQILINQQGFPVANSVGISLQDSAKFGPAISPSSKISSPVSSTTSLSYPNIGMINSGTVSQESGTKIMVQSVNGLTNATAGLLKANQMDQLASKQNLNNVLAQAVGQAVLEQNNTNQMQGQMVNTPMPPLSLPIVTGVTNSLTQVIPAVSGSQQQQSMMNVFNSMGINALQNGSMMLGQIPAALSQDTMQSMSLINGTLPAAAYLNNNIPGGFPRFVACSNGMVNIDSQSGSGNTVVDLGFATKQGQLATHVISGDPSSGCVQLKSSQPIDMAQLGNKLSVQCDGTEQVMQPTVLLPNIQMPLVQLLGGTTDQMQVSQNLDKANMQQFATIPNSAELQGMINQLQAAGQTPVGAPLNLMNVQQVWNNLTTGNNLTAMQLQTLHLQQQLLQQIQQLQGMQTLISQFNVQGNPNNTITTVANKDGNTMATNGQLTFTVSTNASLESVINSESKTSVASVTNSDAVAMGTMVNDVSTTSDFYSQDKSEESDQEEGSLADDNCEQEKEIERECNSELDLITGVPAVENEVVSSSVQTDKCVETTETSCREDVKEHDIETVKERKNSVNVTSSVDTVSDNQMSEQSESSTDGQVVNSDTDKLVNSNCTKCSKQETVSDYVQTQCHSEACVQTQCQSEALNLSTFKSRSTKPCSDMEASNEKETNASQLVKNSDKQNDTLKNTITTFGIQKDKEGKSICRSNLSFEKSKDCDKNEFKVSDSVQSSNDKDKTSAVSLDKNRTVTCSVSSNMTVGSTIAGNTSVSDLPLASNVNIATSSSSTTTENFFSSQSRVKSSPEHRSSIAEKPVEATLPSDIITTKSMDIRNCSRIHLYQASHMVQSVELSSETAEKAADALTIVNKSAKRPLDMEDYLDEDADDSTEEAGISSFPRCFSIGDLVWGQIRGFPSWPGKVVHETEVIDGHQPEDGKCWVKWFGDHTFTEVEPDKLKSLSEGLEAHHRARKKHRKGRKMNSNLEAAIHEAMIELDRQTTLNLESKSQSSKITIQRGKMKKKRAR